MTVSSRLRQDGVQADVVADGPASSPVIEPGLTRYRAEVRGTGLAIWVVSVEAAWT